MHLGAGSSTPAVLLVSRRRLFPTIVWHSHRPWRSNTAEYSPPPVVAYLDFDRRPKRLRLNCRAVLTYGFCHSYETRRQLARGRPLFRRDLPTTRHRTHGEVVDVFLQARRDGKAAKRFFKRLLKRHGDEPRKDRDGQVEKLRCGPSRADTGSDTRHVTVCQ